jgi:hypothetical protein
VVDLSPYALRTPGALEARFAGEVLGYKIALRRSHVACPTALGLAIALNSALTRTAAPAARTDSRRGQSLSNEVASEHAR